jgi:5-methylcytosine-specific restriction endonuclease McrA
MSNRKPHTQETKDKIRKALQGRNLGNTNGFQKGHSLTKGRPAPWARNNPQIFIKGRNNWNEGTSLIKERPCKECGVPFMPTNYRNERKFCSKDCYTSHNRGENNVSWKGGITPHNQAIRTSTEYKLWRKSVFERDEYTCVWCGDVGGRLNADHIKPFSLYPELRLAIDNGRTLCEPCHKTTDTYGGRCNKK